MQFDTTIPLWGAITGTLAFAGTITWAMIKLFFKSQSMNNKVNELDLEQKFLVKQIEDRLLAAREKAQTALEVHKKETDKEFARINDKLNAQNTVLIRVETMVKLLVDNKIKD